VAESSRFSFAVECLSFQLVSVGAEGVEPLSCVQPENVLVAKLTYPVLSVVPAMLRMTKRSLLPMTVAAGASPVVPVDTTFQLAHVSCAPL